MITQQKEAVLRRNEFLKQLSATHDGRLTPEIVFEAAKPQNSPLHDAFEWDINKAAYAHWMDTARELIRSVRLEIVEGERTLIVPYFVRDPEAKDNEQGYAETLRISNDAERARLALLHEIRSADGHLARAVNLAEFFGLQAAVVSLRRRAQRLVKEMAKVSPQTEVQ